jgi:hypothetical protein
MTLSPTNLNSARIAEAFEGQHTYSNSSRQNSPPGQTN